MPLYDATDQETALLLINVIGSLPLTCESDGEIRRDGGASRRSKETTAAVWITCTALNGVL